MQLHTLGSNWARLSSTLQKSKDPRASKGTSRQPSKPSQVEIAPAPAQRPATTSLRQGRAKKAKRKRTLADEPATAAQPSSAKKATRAGLVTDAHALEPAIGAGTPPNEATKRKKKKQQKNLGTQEESPVIASSAAKLRRTTSRVPGAPAAAVAPASLAEAVRLELGRWEVLTKVVERYDASVSPVLGGGDSQRNEQKRKRHLEAWLWSRLFHPLLPQGRPRPGAVSDGDAALAEKLQRAGLDAGEARGRVKRLADALAATAVPHAVAVHVTKEEGSSHVTLACGGRSVDISRSHLQKLRTLYTGKDFHTAAFLLLARYRILQVHAKGGGNQGAVPRGVFEALERWAKQPAIEAFASPLNTLAGAGRYHSAFADVDALFGSRGSFFDASFNEGAVEVNPPFDEDIVLKVSDALDAHLSKAAANGKLLLFLVIIPETNWEGHASMIASKYKRAHVSLSSGQHYYTVGNQHTNTQQSYPASRNTTVLLLASQVIATSSRLLSTVSAAFRQRPLLNLPK